MTMKNFVKSITIGLWCGVVCCVSAAALPELSINLGEHNKGDGLIVPCAGDGVNHAETVAGRDVRRISENSHYLYVQINHPAYQRGAVDLYVSAEVRDDVLARVNLTYDKHSDNPDISSKYQNASPVQFLTGQREWRTLHFFLPSASLQHRQNNSADFRFAAPGVAFRSIKVSTRKPENFSTGVGIDEQSLGDLAVTRKPGMEVTFGNNADPTEAAIYKALSVTSVESYVDWAGVEPEKNQWDWSQWDEQVAVLQQAELKWVPFLIAGPAYATPLWFQNSAESAVFRCLEHGTDSKVQSLFNPALPAQIERFIQAFAERYRDTGVIESVLLGVTGIYGESIYPAGPQGGWTTRLTGDYHNHSGWWAGDQYAIKNFQQAMTKHYKRINRLNRAWQTEFSTFDEVVTFLPENAPNDRARAEFVEWYQQAMTDWSLFWVKVTRKAFPETPIYLCTGGPGIPMLGADFTAQTAAIARYGAGVRITNESSDYPHNFVRTREVASATRHYRTYCGFEPASKVDSSGVVARIYNATASGARQLHDYSNNTLNKGLPSLQNYRANAHWLIPRRPIIKTAIYLSRESWALDTEAHERIFALARKLRDAGDLDLITRQSLADGHLRDYDTLILAHSPVLEEESAKAIEQWVRKGGHLIAATIPGETLGGRLYDQSKWRERILCAIEPKEPLMWPALTAAAPPRWTLNIGSEEDEQWLSGDWSHREKGSEWGDKHKASMRWSGAAPKIFVPVKPGSAHKMRLMLSIPQQAVSTRNVTVSVNSHLVGEITKSGLQECVFEIPAKIIDSHDVALVTLSVKTWKPSDVNPSSKDQRDLGVAVRMIEIVRSGFENATPQAAEFTFRPDRTLLADLRKSVGKGYTTMLPGYAENEFLIASLLPESDDGNFDRRYITVCDDGSALWYNANQARIWQSWREAQ